MEGLHYYEIGDHPKGEETETGCDHCHTKDEEEGCTPETQKKRFITFPGTKKKKKLEDYLEGRLNSKEIPDLGVTRRIIFVYISLSNSVETDS